jgi:hypothetical protein
MGFISVVAMIFIVCLLTVAAGIEFTQFITLPDISAETFKQILTIILLFWAIYAANYWLTGRRKLVSG